MGFLLFLSEPPPKKSSLCGSSTKDYPHLLMRQTPKLEVEKRSRASPLPQKASVHQSDLGVGESLGCEVARRPFSWAPGSGLLVAPRSDCPGPGKRYSRSKRDARRDVWTFNKHRFHWTHGGLFRSWGNKVHPEARHAVQSYARVLSPSASGVRWTQREPPLKIPNRKGNQKVLL